MSLRSRLFSLSQRLSSLVTRGLKITIANKYAVLASAALLALALLSAWYHLRQAAALGEEKMRCRLSQAEFALAAQIQTQELLEQVRAEHEAEQRRLIAQRDAQAQEVATLRQMFDRTVGALETELEQQSQQQPEIVPWLDTPVPSFLLQD